MISRLIVAAALLLAPATQAQIVTPQGMIIRTLPTPPLPLLPPAPPSVAIVSSGTPGLNGAYTVDANAVGNLTSIVTGIAANQGFPGGVSTFIYVDAAGKPHTFPNTAEFVAFAAAIEGYVYASQMAGMGQAATVPTVPLTIP